VTQRNFKGIFIQMMGAAAALGCCLATVARAQVSRCGGDIIATGVVRQVTGGRTLLLADNREVALAALDIPGGIEAAATAELARLTLDKSVVLKGSEPAIDRYGRAVAHVFVGSEGLERSVQHDMVRLGVARVAARVGDGSCASELLTGERRARDAKLGLWADPRYATQRADEPAAIVAERGRLALVEGAVLSVRESGGTIYLNFGRRWSEDFTVTIAKRNERMFLAAGLEPKRLERRRVRVRGFVEERGGPWIEATRPEQIEVLPRQ
jgi:Staphylococcal nuclease homologue